MSQDYDYIVLGCGGIGSGALYWLSRKAGNRVLGLEQFGLGHDRGGSQDHSRMIRMAYNDEKYLRLAHDAYTTFAEVERESGVKLVYITGSLDIARGAREEKALNMIATALDKQGMRYEYLSPAELRRRFPQFTPDDQTLTLYQADGGLLDADLANSVHIQLATARGARVIDHCPVTRVDHSDDYTTVHTLRGNFTCRRLIVTAGAWINRVIGPLGLPVPLKVYQGQATYFATPHVKDFTKDRFPVFVFRDDEAGYYGLPSHVNSYSKIGLKGTGPAVTPETRTYTPDPAKGEIVRAFIQKFIPKAMGPAMYSKMCLHAVPPDGHFIVDSLASMGKPQILVCNGAGHAFKFASLLGKILAELAVDGRTEYDISGFRIDRPALTDPHLDGYDKTTGEHTPNHSKL